MAKIELVGQVITSTNYATERLFDFNPEYVKAAAQHFAASGVTKIEIPEGVLDANNKFKNENIDVETLEKTVSELPKETSVIASYFSSTTLGINNSKYLMWQ